MVNIGRGYMNARAEVARIPMFLVVGNSIASTAPVIRAGMICSVIIYSFSYMMFNLSHPPNMSSMARSMRVANTAITADA